jgi:D-serine deaminase-like pyridoxal phosphate-dependent protein
MSPKQWYLLNRPEETDSPALLVYPERIRQNIQEMIRMAGSPNRLAIHVKTNKMPKVVKMLLKAGIQRFKCATIAEAEMLAESGTKDIVLAYQLNKTKALRFMELIKQYPDCHFSSLVDNPQSAQMLNSLFADNNKTATVYVDIDNGMHRTGITPGNNIPAFYSFLVSLPNLQCAGLHVYDGHLHIQNFEERKRLIQSDFEPVEKAAQKIEEAHSASPEIIAGGTPTFSIHAENPRVICSPGTNVFWDAGYDRMLPEQHYLWAAVLLTRIISKPVPGTITTDLGHKSIAPENPIDKRITFLNLTGYEPIFQSEEHLVLKVDIQKWEQLQVGDELYGIPYHICPTVASYDEAQVVVNGEVTEQWQVVARKRKINI